MLALVVPVAVVCASTSAVDAASAGSRPLTSAAVSVVARSPPLLLLTSGGPTRAISYKIIEIT